MEDSQSDKVGLLKSLKITQDARDDGESQGFSWAVLLGIFLFGVALGAGALFFFYPLPPTTSVERTDTPAQEVVTAPIRRQSNLIASGYVIARRQATVAAEVTGRVTSVRVEEGQNVTEGDILATLDATLVKAELATIQSRGTAAQAAALAIAAELDDARRILERTRTLEAQNFASNADLTRAQARVAALDAQLASARADAATARNDAARQASLLEKYTIRAPFSGVVVDKNAQAGEIISPVSAGGGFTRTGICTIVDMDSLEIEVDVNEAFIGRVRDNQAVNAVLDAYPDWTIPAQVIATVPTANRDKATVRVRIALLEKDPRILPEMAVKVTFQEERDTL